VEALSSAGKAQGHHETVVFEQCDLKSFEDKFGVAGTEIGEMFAYIGEVKERSFANTSGLPEVSPQELGVVADLVSARRFFDRTDCGALLRQGTDDTPRFGTLGVEK
jgi:hypothetical protein